MDLRNKDERATDAAPRPADITTLRLPLDGTEQRDFWDEWNHWGMGTPLYYRPFLDRFPRRVVAAISAIAHAPAGGVLVHCRAGRDRTGLITILLLSLVGVAPEEIAADHALSGPRLAPLFAELGEDDHAPQIEAYLEGQGTTAREAILSLLEELDVESYLGAAGLGDDDFAALRARLLEPIVDCGASPGGASVARRALTRCHAPASLPGGLLVSC